jgi:glycyl-tRNA synthetase
MVGVDCSIIMNPKVWEASGHVGGFADLMVDCKSCKARFRADKVFFVDLGDLVSVGVEADSKDQARAESLSIAKRFRKRHVANPDPLAYSLGESLNSVAGIAMVPCPNCQEKTLTEPRAFNLMFESHTGAVQSEENKVYLRPETAQGIFVNFHNVLDSSRLKLPFGIAQVRSREFEQMEIEFFCHPDESMKWYQYWRDVRIRWYTQLGIKSDKLRPREQTAEERAHYSVGTTDIEYLFPFSDEPQELEGVAHRSDYDLRQHAQHSGKDLSYFDDEAWERDKDKFTDPKKAQGAKSGPPYRFLPHVIEPSAGADRFALAVLCEAYTEDQIPDEKGTPQARVLMKIHPRLAPIKAAIFPLVKKDGMPEKAQALYRELKPHFNVFYDDKGAVGRRYRRQDEAGTPFCITIDGQTLQDSSVTIRDRDTTKQWRVAISAVGEDLRKKLGP